MSVLELYLRLANEREHYKRNPLILLDSQTTDFIEVYFPTGAE